MKKVLTMVAICAAASLASATIYIPGGQFDSDPGWSTATSGATFDQSLGYARVDSTAGNWAVMVNKSDSGLGPDPYSEGVSLASLGLSAGQAITITMDMIEFSGGGNAFDTAGLKIESWTAGSGGAFAVSEQKVATSSGADGISTLTSEWATYTFDYTIGEGATHLKFVPVQHNEISVGYDNIGVVPEPATMGLIGLFGGGMMVARRFRIC